MPSTCQQHDERYAVDNSKQVDRNTLIALCHMQLVGLWSRARSSTLKCIMNFETISVRSSAHPDFVMQDAEEPGEMAGKVGICGESDLANSTDPKRFNYCRVERILPLPWVCHDQCSAIAI